MNKIIFTGLIISLASCSIPFSKSAKHNTSKVKYSGIYVYNNGIDSVIKDYKIVEALKNEGIYEELHIVVPDSHYAAAYGSKRIEYLSFNNDGTCTLFSSHKEMDLEFAEEQHKANRRKNESYKFETFKDRVNFTINFNNTDANYLIYDGTINTDTLVFKVHFAHATNEYPDRLKKFVWYPGK